MTVLCGLLAGLNLSYAFREDFGFHGRLGASFYAVVFALVALGFAR